jgi:hypothetical protein
VIRSRRRNATWAYWVLSVHLLLNDERVIVMGSLQAARRNQATPACDSNVSPPLPSLFNGASCRQHSLRVDDEKQRVGLTYSLFLAGGDVPPVPVEARAPVDSTARLELEIAKGMEYRE